MPVRAGYGGGAIQADDAFAQQVEDLLRAAVDSCRPVGRKHVVEAAVLADDHDDVTDRGARISESTGAGRIVDVRGAKAADEALFGAGVFAQPDFRAAGAE